MSRSRATTMVIAGAVLAIACTRPAAVAPPSAPALSNTPAPVAAPNVTRCPDGLGWLERTSQLRYTELADGHFGTSELHADLRRSGDRFLGVVTMTYRERPDSPARATTRTLVLEHSAVTKLLIAMRDGLRTPPRPTKGGMRVVDTSQSIVAAIDAIAPDVDGDLHVQFFLDDGQTTPHTWGIRGCATDPPEPARQAVHQAVEAFVQRLDRDATIQRLMTP